MLATRAASHVEGRADGVSAQESAKYPANSFPSFSSHVLMLQDLMRIDSERAREIRVTLVEGLQILGSFDTRLREYAAKKLHNQGVSLVKVKL